MGSLQDLNDSIENIYDLTFFFSLFEDCKPIKYKEMISTKRSRQ